ncbi:MAG: manganese efflux pump [Methanolinea sp.]
MDPHVVLALAVSLAIDCFAVSLSAGNRDREKRLRTGLVLGLCFGAFQSGMVLAGHLSASALVAVISRFDHWVAFGILSLIGVKMVAEGAGNGGESTFCDISPGTVVALSVATSLDALGVGFSLGFVSGGIVPVAVAAGVASFLFSLWGSLLGGRLAEKYGRRFEIVGGVVLAAIGTRILLEHLGIP